MKVALCFPGCHTRGGVERVVQSSANYLASKNHDVHVFARDWDADPLGKLHFHKVPSVHKPAFRCAPSYFKLCTGLLDVNEFDVVNVHGVECPTGHVFRVHSLHRAWLETSKRFRGKFSLERIKQVLNPLHPGLIKLEREHYQRRQYQRLIALTEDVKQDLHRYYDVPLADVDVVPNGFDATVFTPEKRNARRALMRDKLGIKPDEIVLLLVANELQRKGYPVILDAMKKLPSAIQSKMKLLVIGRVSTEDVMKPAEAAGLQDRVVACGPTSDVAGYHAAADIFVLPTQYEAFCLAILESLASGLPVITTRVPGAHDAMQNNVNGLLIADPQSADELADALTKMSDAGIRDRMSLAAPASVESFQWTNVMQRYEDILLKYAGQSRQESNTTLAELVTA